LDRQERGEGGTSAVAEVHAAYGIPVHSIVTLDDLIRYVDETGTATHTLSALADYRAEYGCA
jgi:orotate phosphoribosyltransferase